MSSAAELTSRLRKGEQEALFALMTLYYNDLYRYSLRFTADQDLAKDIISQFFLHIWNHHQRAGEADNIKAYLVVSFRRFAVAYLKKMTRELNIESSGNEGYEYSYEDCLIASQQDEHTKSVLTEALRSLPARQLQLVQLRFYDQLTIEEIAARTSLTVRTIYNKLHEAIKKLRSHACLEKAHREGL